MEPAFEAPEDPILAERLGAPAEPIALYLEEASPYRPIATGDIFQGVTVPGSTEREASYDLTMLIAHPSAMRKGAELERRARAAPVTPVRGLSPRRWARGHFDVFPLPLLAEVARGNGFNVLDEPWGALLQVAGPIATEQLDVERRVACLAPEGIHLLLQRVVHADTRFPVREDLLASVFAPKLEELEMLQTWNEEIVAPLVDDGADRRAELRNAAVEFDGILSSLEHRGDKSIRELLESDTRAGEAHRLFAEQIRRRRSDAVTESPEPPAAS